MVLGGAAVAVALALATFAAVRVLGALEAQVESRFRARLIAVPSRVYSAPLVIYPGLSVERAGLFERLQRLNYHPVAGDAGRRLTGGEYRVSDTELRIGRRRFRYPGLRDPGGEVAIALAFGHVEEIRDSGGGELDSIQLEPELIAEIHGPNRQDRRLVSLQETPDHLVEAILAIEDQRFYRHPGLDVRRILGAFLANMRARRVVQGGSTLTSSWSRTST